MREQSTRLAKLYEDYAEKHPNSKPVEKSAQAADQDSAIASAKRWFKKYGHFIGDDGAIVECEYLSHKVLHFVQHVGVGGVSWDESNRKEQALWHARLLQLSKTFKAY